MIRNCKTGLTSAFTGKICFCILGLDLGLGSVTLPLLSLALALAYWPWLTGLGLDNSGFVNIPGVAWQ